MTSCKKDIISHLRTIKVVSQISLPTERDLIVARTVHFREDGADMTIYPGHPSDLGIFWPPRRKCAHPLNGNQKSKPGRRANIAMSEEIMAKWNTLVPIGAGKTARFLLSELASPVMSYSLRILWSHLELLMLRMCLKQ